MTNAGFSPDCKIIKETLSNGKFLKVNDSDTPLEIKIKVMINRLVLDDETINRTYGNGVKYQYHSSWSKIYSVLIKINQLRLKNWFFKPIS
jgi:hypothetical protein